MHTGVFSIARLSAKDDLGYVPMLLTLCRFVESFRNLNLKYGSPQIMPNKKSALVTLRLLIILVLALLSTISPVEAQDDGDPLQEVLLPALNSSSEREILIAISGITLLGHEAFDAVPTLIPLLQHSNVEIRTAASTAVLAVSTTDTELDPSELRAVSAAYDMLIRSGDAQSIETALSLQRILEETQSRPVQKMLSQVYDFAQERPRLFIAVSAIFILFFAIFSVYVVRPVAIIEIEDFLKRFDWKLPKWLGEQEMSIGTFFMLGHLAGTSRALDVWIDSRANGARTRFESKGTPARRVIHIDTPVRVNGEYRDGLDPKSLTKDLPEKDFLVTIEGQGGIGKTSLACQISRWALAGEKADRLGSSILIPVLLERETLWNLPDQEAALIEAGRGEAEQILGEDVSSEMFERLVRKHRILWIIDGFSEAGPQARMAFRPNAPGFKLRPSVVTSRKEEFRGGTGIQRICPMSVSGDMLFDFMGEYLRRRRCREIFSDSDFGFIAGVISEASAPRPVTAMVVKMVLDQAITILNSKGDVSTELPRSLPKMVNRYILDLNSTISEAERKDARQLLELCKATAWACVKSNLSNKPTASRNAAAAFSVDISVSDFDEQIEYISTKLPLLQFDQSFDTIVFLMDPIAEYLAAQYEISSIGNDENSWDKFFDEVENHPDLNNGGTGFLMALRDCAGISDEAIPTWVPDKLAAMAGFSDAEIAMLRERRRVQHYRERLGEPLPDDRVIAINALGDIGEAAKETAGDLVRALWDDDRRVIESAQNAAVQIGVHTDDEFREISRILEVGNDTQKEAALMILNSTRTDFRSISDSVVPLIYSQTPSVSRKAQLAVKKLGVASFPMLIEGINTGMPDASVVCADLIGQIGTGEEDAIQALGQLLRKGDSIERNAAIRALSRLGSQSIPTLLSHFDSSDGTTVQQIQKALKTFGPEVTVPLLTVMAQGGDKVRTRGRQVLAELKSDAESGLIEALKSENGSLREVAIYAAELSPLRSSKFSESLVLALPLSSGQESKRIANALRKIGAAAHSHILQAWARGEMNERQALVPALVAMRKDAVGFLIERFEIAEKPERILLEKVLAQIGKPAIEPLVDVLGDVRASVRIGASQALGKIGPRALSEMNRALMFPSSEARKLVANSAGHFGPRASGFVTSLASLVYDKSPDVRVSAVVALGKIGQGSQIAIDALASASQDESPKVRLSSVVALRKIGRKSSSAIAALEKACRDEDPDVQRSASDALKRLGRK